jgi:hypothetical protein
MPGSPFSQGRPRDPAAISRAMSQCDLRRYHTFRLALDRSVTGAQAARSLGLSERHVWWLRARPRGTGRPAAHCVRTDREVQAISDETGSPLSCNDLRLRDPVYGWGGVVVTNERHLEPGRSRLVRRDVVSSAAHAHSEVRVWSLTIRGDGQMGSHAGSREFPVVQETSVRTTCRNMKRCVI